MQFGNLSLKRCRHGWMLFYGPIIGKCFELYGEYSEPEVSMMRQFLRPRDVAIDIGANIGSLTLPMASMAGHVYAIESHPHNFNVLCANLALNGIQNVKPINAFVTFQDSVNASPLFVSEVWPTPPLAVDALPLESCRLIKIDTDGNELDVLHSAEMSIERFRPILYFENDVRERSWALLEFATRTLGYRLYFHTARAYDPQNNFLGNTENPWAPNFVVSAMMLGVPGEVKLDVQLRPVKGFDDWWDF